MLSSHPEPGVAPGECGGGGGGGARPNDTTGDSRDASEDGRPPRPPAGGVLDVSGEAVGADLQKEAGLDALRDEIGVGDVVDSEEEEAPPRSPLIVAVGSWVKVFDYGKWYSAKVLEVDEDDGHALVHFHKRNSKWDQWVDLAGDRIRLPSPHPQRSAAAALQGVGGGGQAGASGRKVSGSHATVDGEEEEQEQDVFDLWLSIVHGGQTLGGDEDADEEDDAGDEEDDALDVSGEAVGADLAKEASLDAVRDEIAVGTLLRVEKKGHSYTCKVKQTRPGAVHIHYLGFRKAFDEWISTTSTRLDLLPDCGGRVQRPDDRPTSLPSLPPVEQEEELEGGEEDDDVEYEEEENAHGDGATEKEKKEKRGACFHCEEGNHVRTTFYEDHPNHGEVDHLDEDGIRVRTTDEEGHPRRGEVDHVDDDGFRVCTTFDEDHPRYGEVCRFEGGNSGKHVRTTYEEGHPNHGEVGHNDGDGQRVRTTFEGGHPRRGEVDHLDGDGQRVRSTSFEEGHRRYGEVLYYDKRGKNVSLTQMTAGPTLPDMVVGTLPRRERRGRASAEGKKGKPSMRSTISELLMERTASLQAEMRGIEGDLSIVTKEVSLPSLATLLQERVRAARDAHERKVEGGAWKGFLRLEEECIRAIQRGRSIRKAADRERTQGEAREAEALKTREEKGALVSATEAAMQGSDAAWGRYAESGRDVDKEEAVRRLCTSKKKLDDWMAMNPDDADLEALAGEVEVALLSRKTSAKKKKKKKKKKKEENERKKEQHNEECGAQDASSNHIQAAPDRAPGRGGVSDAHPIVARMSSTEEPPDEYLCPITQELMCDPVTASDGHTYERAAIEMWLQRNPSSPKSGLALHTTSLYPNHMCHRLILEWKEAQRVPRGEARA